MFKFRASIFVVLLFAFVGVEAGNIDATCQKRHCIAVVDAGSTGSRLHIYAYDLDGNRYPIKINELFSRKVNPGFGAIELNQSSIDSYLTNLLVNVSKEKLPLYFYATGGLRLLTEETQQFYLKMLQQWFATQSQWNLVDSRVIAGSEEGLFGWLAINYDNGSFSSEGKPLAGVMDMGGASVQITFPVASPDKLNPHDIISLDIYGKNYVLFSHSFLGLGLTETLRRFQNVTACFSNGYPLSSGALGEGDAEACGRVLSQEFNQEYYVNRTIKSAMNNSQSGLWFVMGSVSAMVKESPMDFEGNQFTTQALLQHADNAVCHQSWADLKTLYPKNEYLYAACLTASYAFSLMIDGYGLEPNQVIHLLPKEREFDWTLGVVINQHLTNIRTS